MGVDKIKISAPLFKEDKKKLFPEFWMHFLAYASIHEFSAVIVETMPTQLPPSEYPGATPHTEEQKKYVKMNRLACAASYVSSQGNTKCFAYLTGPQDNAWPVGRA